MNLLLRIARPNAMPAVVRALDLALTVCGIYICYVYYGILQEKLSLSSTKLHYFLMLVQCTLNAMLGMPFMIIHERRKKLKHVTHKVEPITANFMIAVTYVLGMLSSYWSFSYISYPLSVLVKCCKMIPVMLIGRLFGHKYTTIEYACVTIITIGIYGFMALGDSHAKADGAHSSMVGVALSCVSLLCDGLTGAQQDKLVDKYSPSSYRLMFMVNICAVMLLFSVSLLNGELLAGINACAQNPAIIQQLVLFGTVSAVGQLFIFHCITTFGALALAITTSTRKLMTILFSVLAFGHHVTILQWAAVATVFAGIGIDVHYKAQRKRKANTTETKKVS